MATDDTTSFVNIAAVHNVRGPRAFKSGESVDADASGGLTQVSMRVQGIQLLLALTDSAQEFGNLDAQMIVPLVSVPVLRCRPLATPRGADLDSAALSNTEKRAGKCWSLKGEDPPWIRRQPPRFRRKSAF